MILQTNGLVAGYPGAAPVLDGAELQLAAGGRLAILGANGSGKTTLLRCLSGAHRPSAGQVLLDAEPLRQHKDALRAHRRRVQLVLQDPDDQLFSADVSQDVAFGPLNLGLSPDQVVERVEQTLSLLGISQLAGRPTHQLSYGERKRVTIAGAVAMRPAVLLLDEPTAGLDPVGVAEMLAVLDRLGAGGTAIALATHDVDLALAWADQVAVVCAGRVRQGAAVELLADDELLSRAHLRRPWPLELAARLGLAARPRSLTEVLAALTAAGFTAAQRPTA